MFILRYHVALLCVFLRVCVCVCSTHRGEKRGWQPTSSTAGSRTAVYQPPCTTEHRALRPASNAVHWSAGTEERLQGACKPSSTHSSTLSSKHSASKLSCPSACGRWSCRQGDSSQPFTARACCHPAYTSTHSTRRQSCSCACRCCGSRQGGSSQPFITCTCGHSVGGRECSTGSWS